MIERDGVERRRGDAVDAGARFAGTCGTGRAAGSQARSAAEVRGVVVAAQGAQRDLGGAREDARARAMEA